MSEPGSGMKAMVLTSTGGTDQLWQQDMPIPQPKCGEVRVRLQASALNRRDLAIVHGGHPGTKLPCVLGADGAGVVDAVGDVVHEHLLNLECVLYPAREWGDNERHYGANFRVLGMPDPGTLAEFVCVPATDVFPRPPRLSWEQAAAIPLAGLTAWRAAITHGGVRPGLKVLVSGAGSGVSTFAIQWCVALGAQVYVTSGSQAKIDKARTLGALDGFDYHAADLKRQVRAAAGGIDVVIDGAGGDGVHTLLDVLNPAGRYIFYGATLGNPSTAPDLSRLFFRHIRLQGTTMGSPREFGSMLEFAARNEIEPVIDRIMPLRDAVAGLELMSQFGQFGKIILRNASS